MSNSPWNKLEPGDARRVSSKGRFDFFWVVIESGVPGLMLKLPAEPSIVPKLPKLKNLVVSFRFVSGGWAFVLGLKERSQAELFETLCCDIVSVGDSAQDPNDALSKAIQRTRRWSFLLRGGQTEGLSIEEQQGLVGELAFLRDLTRKLGPEAAVDAWKGPSGSPRDFEFIGCCVEVKTRRSAAKPSIVVSSAEQLADVNDGRLFLRVINVESAIAPVGMTIHDHVETTRELFNDAESALDVWEEAINLTGYDSENDYDDRCWVVGSHNTYEVIQGFPRVPYPLLSGIQNLKYSIDLSVCEEFIFKENLMNFIYEKFITWKN